MRIFTVESCGEEIEMVEIETADGQFTVMTKSYWDELEAQKELGGTL